MSRRLTRLLGRCGEERKLELAMGACAACDDIVETLLVASPDETDSDIIGKVRDLRAAYKMAQVFGSGVLPLTPVEELQPPGGAEQ